MIYDRIVAIQALENPPTKSKRKWYQIPNKVAKRENGTLLYVSSNGGSKEYYIADKQTKLAAKENNLDQPGITERHIVDLIRDGD